MSGSTGTVSDNIISKIDYYGAGAPAAATGVLAFYNYGLDITGNSFTGVAGGNLETPVGVYVLDSTDGTITDNYATNVDDGVVVLSDGFGTSNDLLGTWTVTGNTTGTVASSSGRRRLDLLGSGPECGGVVVHRHRRRHRHRRCVLRLAGPGSR